MNPRHVVNFLIEAESAEGVGDPLPPVWGLVAGWEGRIGGSRLA